MSHIESMIEAWWKPFHRLNDETAERPKLTKRVQNKKIVDAMLNAADMLGVDSGEVNQIMKMMLPKKASTTDDISFFNDYNKYLGGLVRHRTKTSPGRFFRKVFPTATDPLVEAFAAFYQTSVVFDPSDYILHVGDTKEDFKKAFRSYHRTRGNFQYQGNVASISDSCMRYAFDRLSDHPSIVYASGDFKVIAVRSKSGKTRARAVVGYKDGAYSLNRIYGSCNHSVQMIREYLSDKPMFDGWDGLKLLKIKAGPPRDNRHYLCPYIDNYRYVSIYDADHLMIYSGTYDASNSTNGYVWWNHADKESTWLVNRGYKAKKNLADLVIEGQWATEEVTLNGLQQAYYTLENI
jgi:hypothetical protein